MNVLGRSLSCKPQTPSFLLRAQASRQIWEDRALIWDEAWSFHYYTGLGLLFSMSKGMSMLTF